MNLVQSVWHGAKQTVTFDYDKSGGQIGVTYPGGVGTVKTRYDKAGRPDTVTDWTGRVYDYTTPTMATVFVPLRRLMA
jgi:uncharacterized protein RhaS with RHS repeats